MGIFGRKKEASPDWQNNSAAALEEANRRIEIALAYEKQVDPVSLVRRAAGYEVFMSDLGALERLPDQMSRLKHARALFIGRASRLGISYRGLEKIQDISPISGMTGLKELSISGTKVNSLRPLRRLKNLEVLDMEETQVSDISDISELPALTEIYMAKSPVSDIRPLARLPVAKAGGPLKFGIRDVPALQHDPRLELLARFGYEKGSPEIIQYLNGTHPAFREGAAAGHMSLPDKLAAASPVKFSTVGGKLEARNRDDFSPFELLEMEAQLRALRVHASDLLEEAQSRQVPEAILSRLKRYHSRLLEPEPLFLTLDGAMSFLRGALRDDYVVAATDGGFAEACRSLVKGHDSLKRRYMRRDDHAEALIGRLADDVTPSELEEAVDAASSAVSEPHLRQDIGKSVVSAVEAIREYADAARASGSDQQNILKRGFLALATSLAALASAATVHLWLVAETGAKFVGAIRALFTALLRTLHIM